jgi:hypothetical protein
MISSLFYRYIHFEMDYESLDKTQLLSQAYCEINLPSTEYKQFRNSMLTINLIYADLLKTSFSTLNNLQTPSSDLRLSQGDVMQRRLVDTTDTHCITLHDGNLLPYFGRITTKNSSVHNSKRRRVYFPSINNFLSVRYIQKIPQCVHRVIM